MGCNGGFGRVKEERKNLSFFKIFQSADLSSECMRALPYNFMKNVSKKDFHFKMVIRAQWGSSWEVDISMNPRFYYMEKSGWNQFVSDNALGANEFVTFTHKGLMCFDVNIYCLNGKEIFLPGKPLTTTPFSKLSFSYFSETDEIIKKKPMMMQTGKIKKEECESSYKDVKKEDESMGGVELEERKKEAEKTKTYKKIKSKKVVNAVEIGESSRKKKPKPSKKKKKLKRKKVKNGVPEFKITIRNSYLKFLAIPKMFEEAYIPDESKMYMIHHSEGKGSWEVLCLVRNTRTIFSSGWSKLAREYPLSVGDRCTFHLVKPTEFVLTSKKARDEITVID